MAETEMLSNNSDQSVPFFEGVEKLLEIWFAPTENSSDLRNIPRSQWEDILKIVRCEIISFTRGEQIDAYVLSESSMFVSQRRLILKTCGTTTPLKCVPAILQLAEQEDERARVQNVFYSRKHFKRPDEQEAPHRSFRDEVELLDEIFGEGYAHVIGPQKDEDRWYLYTLMPLAGTVGAIAKEVLDKDETDFRMRPMKPEPDQTIEMLMTDLDPDIMAIFTQLKSKNGEDATKKSGIEKIIPGMVINDHLFEPCGYSMNGITKEGELDMPNGCYMTIHITPEPEFSYVSFESNVPVDSYLEIITRVIDTFRPGKFVLTVFANPESPAADGLGNLKKISSLGYLQKEIQLYGFSEYNLHYALYCKFPS